MVPCARLPHVIAKQRKPEEDISRCERANKAACIPLALLEPSKADSVARTADGDMGRTLMTWGKIDERWRRLGLRVPEATTTVGLDRDWHWKLTDRGTAATTSTTTGTGNTANH